MVDQPTLRNRFRQQERGTNVNSWGDNLNEVLQAIDQALDGVEAINLGGAASYTLTTTNYTIADEAKNRVLVVSNVHASGSDVVIPAVEHVYGVRNAGAATIEVKLAAGSGVEIPPGRFTWLYCDGTSVVSAANTTLPASFTPSLPYDVVTKTYVDAAVAAGAIPGAPGTVKVDALAAAVYLLQALTAGTDFNISDDGDSLGLSVTPYWNTPRYVDSADSPVAALDRDVIYVDTSATVEIDLPASGRVWIIDQTGDAESNNITVDPAGADTATIDTIDLNYFSAVYTRNAAGNWDIG